MLDPQIFNAKAINNISDPPFCLRSFPTCRLADLMEEHQEELATIEAIDSGAVYTLALKTHVGMSIQTFRYFAGWCDKIQVNMATPTAWKLMLIVNLEKKWRMWMDALK